METVVHIQSNLVQMQKMDLNGTLQKIKSKKNVFCFSIYWALKVYQHHGFIINTTHLAMVQLM